MSTDLVAYIDAHPHQLTIPSRRTERILRYIAARPGLRGVDIAVDSGLCPPSSTTPHLRALEEAGYIHRHRLSAHVIRNEITPLGRHYLEIADRGAA